jgi:glycosyltransferase involved in cell wall biosynthesis
LLGKTLQSIAEQTLSQNNFEVIIVDNGSIDNTKAIVDDYKSTIKNFSILLRKNPGFAYWPS